MSSDLSLALDAGRHALENLDAAIQESPERVNSHLAGAARYTSALRDGLIQALRAQPDRAALRNALSQVNGAISLITASQYLLSGYEARHLIPARSAISQALTQIQR